MKPKVKYYGVQWIDLSNPKKNSVGARFSFVKRHHPGFTRFTPGNNPNEDGYTLGIFTECTQHLMGNSEDELIDAGIACEKAGGFSAMWRAETECFKRIGFLRTSA